MIYPAAVMGLVAVLLGALAAVGDAPSGSLQWTTVAGCPDQGVLEDRLDALGIEEVGTTSWSAHGRLDATDDGYRLELDVSVEERVEHRRLQARDCVVLTDAAALMVAVTVDALATSAALDQDSAPDELPPLARPEVPSPPPAFAPGLPPEPAPTRETLPDDEVSPSPERPRARGVTIGVGGGVAVGLTPEVTGGVEAQLGWRLGSLRLVGVGYHWFSRSTTVQPGAGVESALSGGLLRGCFALERARLEVPLCMGLDLGVMHGAGVGERVRSRPVRDLWVGIAATSGVTTWVSRRIALVAQGEIVVGARRPGMFLDVEGEPLEAFRMPAVGARLLVGPLVRAW